MFFFSSHCHFFTGLFYSLPLSFYFCDLSERHKPLLCHSDENLFQYTAAAVAAAVEWTESENNNQQRYKNLLTKGKIRAGHMYLEMLAYSNVCNMSAIFFLSLSLSHLSSCSVPLRQMLKTKLPAILYRSNGPYCPQYSVSPGQTQKHNHMLTVIPWISTSTYTNVLCLFVLFSFFFFISLYRCWWASGKK